MKILLISLPRTGSTSITSYFNESNKNFKTFSEPFNINGKLGYYTYKNVIKYSNIFVKHMLVQKPPGLKDLTTKEQFKRFYKDFDKIVFLDRKNLTEQVESLSTALVTKVWHTKYVYSEQQHSEYIKEQTKTLKYWKKKMISLSNEYDCKIFYYEDIFYNKEKMLEFLSEINSEYNEINFQIFLDVDKKYRVEKTIKSII